LLSLLNAKKIKLVVFLFFFLLCVYSFISKNLCGFNSNNAKGWDANEIRKSANKLDTVTNVTYSMIPFGMTGTVLLLVSFVCTEQDSVMF
jgi:amino acid transporter